MPLKDPEARKEYNRKWRENNKNYQKQPEIKLKHKIRQMISKNKELENRPDKYEYNHTENQKIRLRYHWCRNIDKICKLRESDFERTWEKYTTTDNCELCNISFKKVKKNMEHNHFTGYFRFVACQRCNGYLRYVDKNFQQVMKQI